MLLHTSNSQSKHFKAIPVNVGHGAVLDMHRSDNVIIFIASNAFNKLKLYVSVRRVALNEMPCENMHLRASCIFQRFREVHEVFQKKNEHIFYGFRLFLV